MKVLNGHSSRRNAVVGQPGNRSDYGDNQGAEDCPTPIFRGMVVTPFKSSYKDEETIEISCKEGYEFKANQTNTTCFVKDIFGGYGAFIPAVTPSTCTEKEKCIKPNWKGLVLRPQKKSYEEGDIVVAWRGEGYYLRHMGSMYTTCKKVRWNFNFAMQFSPSIPSDVCIDMRCSAPEPKPGVIITPLKDKYYIGDVILISCAEGYELVGPATSRCAYSKGRLFLFSSIFHGLFIPALSHSSCQRIVEASESEPEVTDHVIYHSPQRRAALLPRLLHSPRQAQHQKQPSQQRK